MSIPAACGEHAEAYPVASACPVHEQIRRSVPVDDNQVQSAIAIDITDSEATTGVDKRRFDAPLGLDLAKHHGTGIDPALKERIGLCEDIATRWPRRLYLAVRLIEIEPTIVVEIGEGHAKTGMPLARGPQTGESRRV